MFKRFKSLAQLGHVPKYNNNAKAWLCSWRFLAEQLLHQERTIPPGATTCRRQRPRSAWRDFKFALNQVKRAIEPPLSLAGMGSIWPLSFSAALAIAPFDPANVNLHKAMFPAHPHR